MKMAGSWIKMISQTPPPPAEEHLTPPLLLPHTVPMCNANTRPRLRCSATNYLKFATGKRHLQRSLGTFSLLSSLTRRMLLRPFSIYKCVFLKLLFFDFSFVGWRLGKRPEEPPNDIFPPFRRPACARLEIPFCPVRSKADRKTSVTALGGQWIAEKASWTTPYLSPSAPAPERTRPSPGARRGQGPRGKERDFQVEGGGNLVQGGGTSLG